MRGCGCHAGRLRLMIRDGPGRELNGRNDQRSAILVCPGYRLLRRAGRRTKTRQWKTVPTLMTASEPRSPSQLLGQDCKWRQKRGGGRAGYGLHPRDHASRLPWLLREPQGLVRQVGIVRNGDVAPKWPAKTTAWPRSRRPREGSSVGMRSAHGKLE